MHDLLQTRLFADSRLAVDAMAMLSSASAEERGAIHTRPEVAGFVLAAVGWTDSHPLESCRLLEPSFGEGDFLLPEVEALLKRVRPDDLSILPCIRAVEVSRSSREICKARVEALFSQNGWYGKDVSHLFLTFCRKPGKDVSYLFLTFCRGKVAADSAGLRKQLLKPSYKFSV